jgi:hypothetical protein
MSAMAMFQQLSESARRMGPFVDENEDLGLSAGRSSRLLAQCPLILLVAK